MAEKNNDPKQKTVLFAFRGDPLCFVHVLLNGLDLHANGQQGKIVLEGESVTLVEKMSQPGHFLSDLYQKAKDAGIIHGACKACSAKLKATKAVENAGIPLIGDMNGHPAMSQFLAQGYQVITF
ncbi:DsrE family protein [Desulfotignum phosphitoxidans]|uniref:DsrE/DrsF family protein, sulfur relay protein n=1 Tax=Desulfotignum phosphitoxidans DSM 13687 TaxID=1286635 RepID=S0FYS0_9BACT|nr:DsrE family protein [Desulfotignum phosphitoxidans]EMS80228.1 DsrE/DrsF family protein, sulfur relay protein [Desulfotignum phosphitoxidans DSM 13687]